MYDLFLVEKRNQNGLGIEVHARRQGIRPCHEAGVAERWKRGVR
jgi:hypothetical protein